MTSESVCDRRYVPENYVCVICDGYGNYFAPPTFETVATPLDSLLCVK